jgi:Fcf2 pre-rRNA processing.
MSKTKQTTQKRGDTSVESDESTVDIMNIIALAKESTNAPSASKMKLSSNANPLSEVISGYVAPLSLDSSSLDPYKNSRQKLESEIISASKEKSVIIPNIPTFASKNFKVRKPNPADIESSKSNAGSRWFNFQATPNSASLQADIAVIRNRNYLDPKKFYKSSDFNKKGSHLVQLGTVVEGSMESVYSNRLTKKQRRSNVMEEVMSEVFQSKNDYVKKTYTKLQRERTASGIAARGRKVIKGKGAFRKKGFK